MAKKKWIQKSLGRRPKRGALHRALGVPSHKPIPVAKLKAAAKKPGKLGRRARFAITLRKLSKKRWAKRRR